MIATKKKCVRCETPTFKRLCSDCQADDAEAMRSGESSRGLRSQLNGEQLVRLREVNRRRQEAIDTRRDVEMVYGSGHFIADEFVEKWRSEKAVYSTDGGVIRHGHLPEDEENFKPSSFCGLCVINPT